MEEDNCEKCRFYRETLSERGLCKRRSPVRVRQTYKDETDSECYFVAVWPEVEKTDWCGEFEK